MEEKNGKLSIVMSSEKDGKSGGKKSFWHIDKQMLPLKMHFFLFVGGMGAILPFQSAFAITKLGLTASNLAAAYTSQQFLFIFLKPGVGYLADYFNRLKATIVGLTVLQAIFCFCMIMIPSASVPERDSSQYNISINNNNFCHLCNHSEELKNVSLKQPLAEFALRKVLNCLKNTEMYGNYYEEMHCPTETSDHLYSMNISFRIMQKYCGGFLTSNSSTADYTTENNLYTGNVLFVARYLDDLQDLFIACLSPKEKNMFKEFLPYDNMKESCHVVPNIEFSEVQYLFLATPLNTTNCQNYKSNASSSHVSYEHDAALSTANFKTYQFWCFTLCLILSCTCISCIFTISDTACHEFIVSTQADYGIQRAWGAVSWGIISPFAGFLNDYTDSYMASWCLMVLFCSLQIWNLSKLTLAKPDFSQSIMKDIKAIFSSFEFIAFEIGVLMNGMFTGVIWFYLTWYLMTIGGNRLIIGLAHTVQCFLGEVPMMFLSGWMIKKLGHFHMLTLALLSYTIRFFIYSYLHNPWLVLPVEILHGFTFGSFYSAMTSYGKLNSKPGTEATTQSVLCATYEALGAGLGCVISGIFFDYYGAHTTFYYASFTAVISTIIHVVFTVLTNCRKRDLDVTKTTEISDERY